MNRTRIYMLRHAKAEPGDKPNRERPLSDRGRCQAAALTPLLRRLGCMAVYSSPFLRAVETVRPFCLAKGLPLVEVEALGESAAEEALTQVRDRMVQVVSHLADLHPKKAILVCTHGGNLWGLLSAINPSFGYDQYRRLGTPDMRLLHWRGRTGTVDEEFHIEGIPDR